MGKFKESLILLRVHGLDACMLLVANDVSHLPLIISILTERLIGMDVAYSHLCRGARADVVRTQ